MPATIRPHMFSYVYLMKLNHVYLMEPTKSRQDKQKGLLWKEDSNTFW